MSALATLPNIVKIILAYGLFIGLFVGVLRLKGASWRFILIVMIGLGLCAATAQIQISRENARKETYRKTFTSLIERCKPACNYDAPAAPDSLAIDGKVIVCESGHRTIREPGNSFFNFSSSEFNTHPSEDFINESFTATTVEEAAAVVFIEVVASENGKYSGDGATGSAFDAEVKACLVRTSDLQVLGTKRIQAEAPNTITVKKRRGYTASGYGSGEPEAKKQLSDWLRQVTP